MREIKIKALNKIGQMAINKHIEECKEVSIKDRLMAKQLGYRQELLSTDPFIYSVRITSPTFQNLINEEDMKNKFIDTLKENGAILDIDYELEVL